ncbi:MAG: aspartate carbamoyltransferase catalytic subunit [Streptococcaceae bacterium]|jgi:aspartate carbamoyltransferase catalytic subunit|nr:aspartate carbamoyltransferase catalytic subunit [Streptococcaceae bacterium]
MEDYTPDEILALLKRAREFKSGASWDKPNKQIFAANLFFENSTRTHNSFHIAERKLGLDVLEFNASQSSVKKGETLYDTVLTLDALGVEVCVLRHSTDHYYDELINSENIHCAIVNGGDGSGQHPSQCLLDLMTIQEEFGDFTGLQVGIAGDISHSRVARSNAQMLTKLGAKVYFSGPKEWYNPDFDQYGQFLAMDDLVQTSDVVMLLRVQHERQDEKANASFSKADYHKEYGLTLERASQMKGNAIIMHPAPVNRDVELADALVESPQSRIVKQMTNGVYARMAILESVLK